MKFCFRGGRNALPVLCATLLCGLVAPADAQWLYDGSLGTFPADQGFSYLALGPATQTLTNNSVVLDTSASTTTQAGYSRVAPVALDHTNGFTLVFTVQINAETHNNTNRAGFSIIALSDDKHGIELGFWTGLIFAQSDSPLFVHAEDTAVPTSLGYVDYALTMLATNYVLRANGIPVLSGPVRDYTAFNGPINPYRTPNFLFFGDDTTSASASMALRKIVLVTPPALSISSAGTICWTGVSNQTYTVESSTNLADWAATAAVTSSSNSFCFTNAPVLPKRFFRVTFP